MKNQLLHALTPAIAGTARAIATPEPVPLHRGREVVPLLVALVPASRALRFRRAKHGLAPGNVIRTHPGARNGDDHEQNDDAHEKRIK